jgi:RNA polymerase sigma-70 factor (ECF subfamily)
MLYSKRLDEAGGPDAFPVDRGVLEASSELGDSEEKEHVDAKSPFEKVDIRKELTSVLPRVRNLVRYLVPGDQEVDDIAQEALVNVVRGYASYRGEAPFERWVDRVVVRTTFRWLADRSRSRARVASVVVALDASPDTTRDDYAARRYVVQLLDTIPEPQRHCVVLHHVLGMSVSEVAETMHVPAETVRSRLRLGLQRLREKDCDVAGSHFDEDDDEHT